MPGPPAPGLQENNTSNYGTLVRGYLEAPETGTYTILIRSDDASEIFLSTSESHAPGNLVRVAYEPGCCTGWVYDGIRSSQPIQMERGKKYYFEMLHKEGGGGDWFQVGWRLPSGVEQLPILARHLAIFPLDTNTMEYVEMAPTFHPPGVFYGSPFAGSHPLSTTVTEGETAMFVSSVEVSQPATYQWYRNDTAIPGAILSYYQTSPVTRENNGDKYHVVVQNVVGGTPRSVASNPAILSVRPDAAPPLITSVLTRGNTNGVEITFSEPVSTASAQDSSNYMVINAQGQQITVQQAVLVSSNRVQLVTGNLPEGTVYYLRVSGVRDASPNQNILPAQVHAFLQVQGLVERREFHNIGGILIADLTNSTAFRNNTPNVVDYRALIETPVNVRDNYGVQFRGYITPPLTGEYIFAMSSDDQGALYLSTDDNPANKRLIAGEPVWGDSRTFHHSGGQQPTRANAPGAAPNKWANVSLNVVGALNLEAGKKYYIEAMMKEGGGGDNLAVAWTMPGDMPGVHSERISPVTLSSNPDVMLNQINYAINHSYVPRRSPFNGSAPIGAEFLSPFGIRNGPVAIGLHPTNRTVAERAATTFVVGNISGPLFYTYQWHRDGTAIPGATNITYTIPSALPTHAGNYHCVVSNSFSGATSQVAQLTVTPDTVAPTLLSARGGPSRDRVTLTFSEPMAPGPANTIANYTIPGLTILSAQVVGTGNKVVLHTSLHTPGQEYQVTVSNLQDTAVTPNPLPTSTARFHGWVLTRGYVTGERYLNIGNSTLVADLKNQTKYPYAPDVTQYLLQTAVPTNIADNFGTRLSGYVIPPVTGEYMFFIISDDNSELWLSTDDNPANKQLIAQEPVWTNPPMFREDGIRNSQPIELVAGRLYYFEALQKEGGGGDFLAVAWRDPESFTDASGLAPIPANYLASYNDPEGASITFQRHPQDTTVKAGRRARFSVVAPVTNPTGTKVFYQWQRDGVDIPGANSPVYETAPAGPEEDGSKYRCFIAIPGVNALSQEATLRVVPPTGPQLISATAFHNSRQIGICFDVPLRFTLDLLEPSNYVINGANATVQEVNLMEDSASILLVLNNPLTTQATLTVRHVEDTSEPPMISANLTAPIQLVGLTAQDIGVPGDPASPGSYFTCNGRDFTVRASGSDIWNTTDRFYFIHQQLEGDFDMMVQVKSLLPTDPSAKAGLMVRESLDPNSRNHMVLVMPEGTSPTGAGRSLFVSQHRSATGGTSTDWPGATRPNPVPYPDAWLRLQREGGTFRGYWSQDGISWSQFAVSTPASPYPNTVYIGMAVTSHNNNFSTVAELRNFQIVTPITTPPTLFIERLVSGDVRVSWDPPVAGFVLQETPSLAAPIWTPLGSQTPVVRPTSDAQRYYRLVKP